MQIVLDESLEEATYFKERSLANSLLSLANGGSTRGKTELYLPINPEEPMTFLRNPGFIGLLSHAYCYHLNVAIAPHDIWSVLIADIAKFVTAHPETFRHLFTDSPEKKKISIPSGSLTEIPLNILSEALSRQVKFDSSILFPKFSTSEPIIEEHFNALFCDMSSSYYNYSMFCCGIKAIKLLGTKEDWTLLRNHFIEVANVFSVKQHLIDHFENVKYILGLITDSFDTEQIDFWKDIFTQKNIGSGGDLTIDGWITDLFIVKHSFKKIENFISDTAKVEYTQEQTKQKFASLTGGFDYKKSEDNFLSLNYSKHIFRLEEVQLDQWKRPIIVPKTVVNKEPTSLDGL